MQVGVAGAKKERGEWDRTVPLEQERLVLFEVTQFPHLIFWLCFCGSGLPPAVVGRTQVQFHSQLVKVARQQNAIVSLKWLYMGTRAKSVTPFLHSLIDIQIQIQSYKEFWCLARVCVAKTW